MSHLPFILFRINTIAGAEFKNFFPEEKQQFIFFK